MSSSAAVAAAANAFETAADAGDAIAAADALRAITQAARTPGAARDAVPALASRLARIAAEGPEGSNEGSESWDSQGYLPGYLPDLLRALRNACAGDRDATDATCLGVAPVPNALRRLIPVLAAEAERQSTEAGRTGPECDDASNASNGSANPNPAATALVVATLAANAHAAGSDAASSRLWSELWPRAASYVAQSRRGFVAGAHPPLCMMAHDRVRRIIGSKAKGSDASTSWGVGPRRAPHERRFRVGLVGARFGSRCWRRRATRRWRRGRARGVAVAPQVRGEDVFPEFAPQLCRSLAPRAERRLPTATTGSSQILTAGGPDGSDRRTTRRRRRAAALATPRSTRTTPSRFRRRRHLCTDSRGGLQRTGVDPAGPDAGHESTSCSARGRSACWTPRRGPRCRRGRRVG